MTTTKPELKPCPWCNTQPIVHHFPDNDEPSCTCGRAGCVMYQRGYVLLSWWNKRASTPTSPVDDDAVEAFANHVFGGDTELIMQKARECVADLTAAGFTITRAAAPMTDFDLNLEAERLAYGAMVDADRMQGIIALAKKYRGYGCCEH